MELDELGGEDVTLAGKFLPDTNILATKDDVDVRILERSIPCSSSPSSLPSHVSVDGISEQRGTLNLYN